MKRFIVCTLLVAAFGTYDRVQAQFRVPELAWGLAAGGSHGTNNKSDEWGMQYRAFLQGELAPMLLGQFGLGYTSLSAPDKYTAQTGIADLRLLFSPFSLTDLNPYVYAGFGLSKNFSTGGTNYLGMVPVGAGIQTRIASGVLLDVTGGYNLSLSDKLDGRERSNTDLNGLTNGKQDGYYGFTIGLAFSLGSSYMSADDTKKKELAEAEARRVKELAEAEARRVKQQADADAEARRLAELKTHDTLFVLVKGKTVVLRGVNFEFDKATLTKDSEIILRRAYRAMVANPDVRIVITGHTDNVGDKDFNQGLSLERAQAVKNWLVEKGIASNRMRTVGRGENEPVASNTTDAGRAENRRMEFFVEQ